MYRQSVPGQIFLDAFNPILLEAIAPRLRDGKREPCELRVADFDDVAYKLTVPLEKLSQISLSISMTGYEEIMRQGGRELLAATYGSMVASSPQQGYNLTLIVDADNLPKPADEVIKSLTEVRRNILGLCFDRAFSALAQGKASSIPLMTLPWRQTEKVYIVPQADRVTVIFAVDFPADDERAIAKVFMHEFADAQRSANNAPPCNFTPEPPLELQGLPFDGKSKPVGYLSFVIFPQHVEEGRHEKTVTLLTGFRNYLHYHLKATKTYMHMRMRKRVAALLQVLNRAKPEEEDKDKKTAQGKTFSRAGSAGGM